MTDASLPSASTLRSVGLALVMVCAAVAVPVATTANAQSEPGSPSTVVKVAGLERPLALDPGEEKTVRIVVPDADGGVGSFDLSVEVADDDVAEITDVTVPGSLDAAVTDVAGVSDDDDVDVRAAGTDSADTGQVSLARVTVRGNRSGTTDLRLRALTLGTEADESYTITGSPDKAVVVGDGEPPGDPGDPTPTPTPTPGDPGNEPPEVDGDIDANGTGDGYAPPVRFRVVGVDSDGTVERVEYSVDGGEFTPVEGDDATVSLEEPGSYTVAYRAVDDDGATSETRERTVRVDESPFESLEASYTTVGQDRVDVSMILTEDIDRDDVELALSQDGETIADRRGLEIDRARLDEDRYRYTTEFVEVDAGETYRVTLTRATEGSHDWADGQTTTVNLSRPVVQLRLDPRRTEVVEGQSVRFRVVRASDGFGVRNATVSIDGDVVGTGDDSFAEYTFSEPGTYTATATRVPDENYRYRSDGVEIEVVEAVGPTNDTEPATPWPTFQGGYARTGAPTPGREPIREGGEPREIRPVTDPTEAWPDFAAFSSARLTSPVTAGGIVYAARGSSDGPLLAAFDASDGEVRWTWTSPLGDGGGERTPDAAPVVVRDVYTDRATVYLTDAKGAFYAVDAREGTLRWRMELTAPGRSSGTIREAFAVVDGIAFVPVDDPGDQSDDGTSPDALVAINLRTQEVLWRYEAEHVGGVAVHDERLYVAAGEEEMLVKFDADGEESRYWSHTTPTDNGVARGDTVLGAPTVHRDTVYVRDETGAVRAIDPETGEANWTRDGLPGTPNEDNPPSMAAADGRLFVSQGEHLIALDAGTGERLWSVSRATPLRSPAVVNDTLYVPTADGTLHGVDAATGDRLWTHETDGSNTPETSVAVADGTVFFRGADPYLHAVSETPTTGVLTGVVRDRVGAPVADATVRVAPPLSSDRFAGPATAATTTGPDGRYRLRVPTIGPSATYRLTVDAPDHESYSQSDVVVAAGGPTRLNVTIDSLRSATNVSVAPAATSARVGQPVTFELTVTDDTGASPVPIEGVAIEATPSSPAVTVRGSSTVETAANGTARVTVVATESVDATVEFAVPAAGLRTVAGLTVEPASTGPPPVGDFANPPTDPDDDGEYEDVNGDGEVNVVDVQALFVWKDGEVVRSHVAAFDFNDDSVVDIIDVQALFAREVN